MADNSHMTLWDVQFGRGKVNVVVEDASDGRGAVPVAHKPKRRTAASELRQGEAGLAWIRHYLAHYDLSLIESIRIERGKSRKAVGVYGKCFFPTQDRPLYRVTCMIPGPFPCKILIRKPPLYMNEDGSFGPMSPNCRRGLQCLDKRTGRRWFRMLSHTELHDLDQAIVWIMAHEAFHYLRRTKQIPGRNNEIQADAYGDDLLAQFVKERDALCAHLSADASLPSSIAQPAVQTTHKSAGVKRKVSKKTIAKAESVKTGRAGSGAAVGTRTVQSTAVVKPVVPPIHKSISKPVVKPAGLLIKTVASWMGLWSQPPLQKRRK